jgi:hypothetical protein
MEVNGQLDAPATFPLRKEPPDDWWIRKELEKKQVWRYYPGIYMKRLRKNMKTLIRRTGVSAEFRTVHLHNAYVEPYRRANLVEL